MATGLSSVGKNVRRVNSIFLCGEVFLVFSQVGSCVANLVNGLCVNTSKLSAKFSRQKRLGNVSKFDGVGVPLLVVVSQIHQHLQCRNLADMVFFKTWSVHF